MGQSRIAIIIPAFREGGTIEAVVQRAAAHGDVIVVDDCSPDDTAVRAAAGGASVVGLTANQGYDGALSRGFEEAAARGYSHVVTLDADGEHDPALLARFRDAMLFDGAQLVIGVRARKQRVAETVMGWYIRRRFGVRDILCGMKGYDLDLWRANGGFDHARGIGTELAVNSMRRGVTAVEIPVSGTRRVDAPRFDRPLRANLRIMAALWRVLADRTPLAAGTGAA